MTPTTTFDSPNILRTASILFRSRTEAVFAWSWSAVIGCLIAARGAPPLGPSLLAVMSMIFLSFSTYIYNDLLDAEQDKLNPIKKKRPIPLGKVSAKMTRMLVGVTACAGLLIIFFVNVHSFLFALAYWVLFTVYSYRRIYLKSRFLVKELTIAVAFPLTGLVGVYAATGSFSPEAFLAMLMLAFFAFLVQPVATDSTDIKEDKLAGVHTLASRTSWSQRILLLMLGATSILMAVPIVYAFLDFNALLLIIGLPATLVYFAYLISTRHTIKANPLKIRHISHAFFVILQLSLVLGSLNI